MAALGLGMGMGMPNLTAAVQNAVDHREVGAATGAMAFVRSLGGALGVATSGAIMAHSLAITASGQGRTLAQLTQQAALAVTSAEQGATALAYRTALTGCFLLSGAVMTLAFVVTLGMPERMLRSRIEDERRG
jgi:MFS family permease